MYLRYSQYVLYKQCFVGLAQWKGAVNPTQSIWSRCNTQYWHGKRVRSIMKNPLNFMERMSLKECVMWWPSQGSEVGECVCASSNWNNSVHPALLSVAWFELILSADHNGDLVSQWALHVTRVYACYHSNKCKKKKTNDIKAGGLGYRGRGLWRVKGNCSYLFICYPDVPLL